MLQEKIEDISYMGSNRTKSAITYLTSKMFSIISDHAAIPEEELRQWVEDGLKEI